MKTASYKGYCIAIKQEPETHPDYSYVAYINDVTGGREHTRGSSEENALERLKDRIDNYSSFNHIHYIPLSNEKQLELVSYISLHANEVKRVLQQDHYILPGRFQFITATAIYNHYKLIQDTLCSAGYDMILEIAQLERNGTIDKIILYDSKYYSTSIKLERLKSILENL